LILEEAFEPIVIFFELINSLVTFQAIINNLIRNIIKKENVIVFTDDIIVRIEIEKKYDKIVEKILRRIVKNNLFVKLKKYI